MRYELAGASIGTWYRGWRFVQEATALASMVLQQFDAFDFNSPLPGLGIPSDFAILADPVSLGMEVRARHDVLLAMCLCLSSRHDGRLYTPMLSAPAMPLGSHGGNAMVALMLQTLEAHPAGLGRLRVGHGAPLSVGTVG